MAKLEVVSGVVCCLAFSGCAVDSGSQDSSLEAVAQEVAAVQRATPLVYDSDMDFDDTVALAYLARAHRQGRIELRAVTVTNNGAGFPGKGALHARCLLQRFGLEGVRVAEGSNVGTNPFPPFVRSLIDTIISDTLADCTLAPEPSTQTAAELIAAEIRTTRRPLTILATGPVSNLSAAFQGLDQRLLAGKLNGVFSMGGAVHVPGGLLVPDPSFDGSQEVNYWADPSGTARMFERVPTGKLTMVGLDATNSVPITFAFLDRLAATAVTPEARYVSALLAHPFARAGLESGQPAFWWDPLAAVSSLEAGPHILDYERDRIRIVEEGPSAGRTLVVASHAPGNWVRVAIGADQAAFEREFLSTLNAACRKRAH